MSHYYRYLQHHLIKGYLFVGFIVLLGASGCDGGIGKSLGSSQFPDVMLDSAPVQVVPPRSLREVASVLPAGVVVRALDIAEEADRVVTVALAPPSREPEDIAKQYSAAYEKNFALLQQLMTIGIDNATPSYQEGLKAERQHLEVLKTRPRTPDVLIVTKLLVDGQASDIEALREVLSK